MSLPGTISGRGPGGNEIRAVSISGGALTARFLTLGATLQDLRPEGVPYPLVLGSDDPAAYTGRLLYAGAIVGPVANRISGASAVLGGTRHRFEPPDGGDILLHGGAAGLHARIWQIADLSADSVTFRIALADGDGAFPGNREIRARFRLFAPATLEVDLMARTDAPTWMNLAHHGYWNLDGSASVHGHRLQVKASSYLPVSAALIPDGLPRDVAGGAYDFRQARRLDTAPPLDHNFCLSRQRRAPTEAVRLTGASGLRLRMETTEPGVQIYDGRHFEVPPGTGLDGRGYRAGAGLALEAQGWPDAPNREDFPSITLRPGETYHQITRFHLDRTGSP